MRAIVVTEYGDPDVLSEAEVPEPEPGPGEVTIAVAFAGVNYTDVRNRLGDGLGKVPFTPGVEAAGVIRAVGEGVGDLTVGQPVAALTRGNAYAEVVRAPAVLTVPLPPELVGQPAAGGTLITVHLALLLLGPVARVAAGERVLLHAAAGGVGTVVGQLAPRYGVAALYGTVGGSAKVAFAKAHGYTDVFGYHDFDTRVRRATGGAGLDLVLDPIGSDVRARSFELLAPFGRLVTYSNISREPEVCPDADWLRAHCVGYVGFSGGQLSAKDPAAVRESLTESVRLVAAGEVDVEVTDVLPLERAADAHRRFERREATGKLILAL